ncbi:MULTISPECIES: tetratricopeptide repeat protein [unclassified Halomonas]|uniref:tetratricopeptide repeat protein n=1 Tax=unclassified Halomonas TaxID=2609666 RepID=UPI001CF524A2|nr:MULTISPECIES: tetratricopeptide repeat protein [unclassified Halomonas]UZH08683.1 tetratricopeptide repeat protein [Halomonas sp. BDJS001]
MLRHSILLPAAASAALLLSGCQSTPSPQDGPLGTWGEDPMHNAPPITRGLDASGLSTLLGAELAGQRGDYRYASQGYLEAAKRYREPALAERATFAARFGDEASLIEASALRWRELDPEAEAPNRLLAAFSLQRGDWLDSLEQRLDIVEAGGHGDITAFAEIAAAEEEAPLRLIAQQLQEHLARPNADQLPHHSDVLLGTALIEATLGDTAPAQRRLDQVEVLDPESAALWLVKARLALEVEDYPTAQRAAQQGLELAPDDVRFILLLAQAEIRLNNISAAEVQTNALLESHGGNEDLRLSLAQLYLEEGHPEPAQRLLQPLIGQPQVPDLAYYLLGAITQAQDDIDNALLYYRQVSEGSEFLPARAAAAQMLIEEDRLLDARAFLRIERMRFDNYFSELVMLEVQLLDEINQPADADALLDREISRTPDDASLLYMRSMRRWEAGNISGMEQDLRQILRTDPNNAEALNALGYTLADLNLPGRLQEAFELIERAYEADPNNPAVLDSMGWVYFRLGEPEEALPWLESAYTQLPDQEVAAHLAEVLKALGRDDEARQLIQQIMQRTNQHPLIDELLERYPELTPPETP